MQNYYIIEQDEEGEYVNDDGERCTVIEVAPERVHIPVEREGEMTLYDSLESFLADNEQIRQR